VAEQREAPVEPSDAAGRGKQPVPKKSKRGRPAKERLQAQAKVIDLLKASGGRLPKKSERRLGKITGARKSTMHLALAGLIAAGLVAKTAAGLVLVGHA
jgi:hypothetical protein